MKEEDMEDANRHSVIKNFLWISALLLFLSSCATTTLTTTWHDAGYEDKNALQDVLIIAVVKDETTRRLYEDGFVATLAESGIRGIQSYALQESDIEPTREAVEKAVVDAGAQFVLITRHLGTDKKEHYRPPERVSVMADPYYSRYNRYYPLAYREVYYTPGYTYTVTTVSLEANLYDARTEKIIWTAQSKSVDPKMSRKYLDGLISVFSKDLQEKGLL